LPRIFTGGPNKIFEVYGGIQAKISNKKELMCLLKLTLRLPD